MPLAGRANRLPGGAGGGAHAGVYNPATEFFFKRQRGGDATLTKKVGLYTEALPFQMNEWCPYDVFDPFLGDEDDDSESSTGDEAARPPHQQHFEARTSEQSTESASSTSSNGGVEREACRTPRTPPSSARQRQSRRTPTSVRSVRVSQPLVGGSAVSSTQGTQQGLSQDLLAPLGHADVDADAAPGTAVPRTPTDKAQEGATPRRARGTAMPCASTPGASAALTARAIPRAACGMLWSDAVASAAARPAAATCPPASATRTPAEIPYCPHPPPKFSPAELASSGRAGIASPSDVGATPMVGSCAHTATTRGAREYVAGEASAAKGEALSPRPTARSASVQSASPRGGATATPVGVGVGVALLSRASGSERGGLAAIRSSAMRPRTPSGGPSASTRSTRGAHESAQTAKPSPASASTPKNMTPWGPSTPGSELLLPNPALMRRRRTPVSSQQKGRSTGEPVTPAGPTSDRQDSQRGQNARDATTAAPTAAAATATRARAAPSTPAARVPGHGEGGGASARLLERTPTTTPPASESPPPRAPTAAACEGDDPVPVRLFDAAGDVDGGAVERVAVGSPLDSTLASTERASPATAPSTAAESDSCARPARVPARRRAPMRRFPESVESEGGASPALLASRAPPASTVRESDTDAQSTSARRQAPMKRFPNGVACPSPRDGASSSTPASTLSSEPAPTRRRAPTKRFATGVVTAAATRGAWVPRPAVTTPLTPAAAAKRPRRESVQSMDPSLSSVDGIAPRAKRARGGARVPPVPPPGFVPESMAVVGANTGMAGADGRSQSASPWRGGTPTALPVSPELLAQPAWDVAAVPEGADGSGCGSHPVPVGIAPLPPSPIAVGGTPPQPHPPVAVDAGALQRAMQTLLRNPALLSLPSSPATTGGSLSPQMGAAPAPLRLRIGGPPPPPTTYERPLQHDVHTVGGWAGSTPLPPRKRRKPNDKTESRQPLRLRINDAVAEVAPRATTAGGMPRSWDERLAHKKVGAFGTGLYTQTGGVGAGSGYGAAVQGPVGLCMDTPPPAVAQPQHAAPPRMSSYVASLPPPVTVTPVRTARPSQRSESRERSAARARQWRAQAHATGTELLVLRGDGSWHPATVWQVMQEGYKVMLDDTAGGRHPLIKYIHMTHEKKLLRRRY